MHDPQVIAYRQIYVNIQQKQIQKQPLISGELIIASVIDEHPEFHHLLTDIDSAMLADTYHKEINPFLHMGLHIAVREQMESEQFSELKQVFQSLVLQSGKTHETEHDIMAILAKQLHHQSQNNQPEFDTTAYIKSIKSLFPNTPKDLFA